MSKKSILKPIPPPSARWEPPSKVVIPSLDTMVTPNEHIEQIEQLITIRLQNIDANLSRIQSLMATRLLPAFKRYAVGTQPVREAAQFWTAFFEYSAQIRIPTTEEYTIEQTPSANEPSDQIHQTPNRVPEGDPLKNEHTFDPDVTPSETSFVPGQMAGSSTPMHRPTDPDESYATQNTSVASNWLQDSLHRLDKGIQQLALTERSEDQHEPAELLQPRRVFAPPPDTSILRNETMGERDKRKERGAQDLRGKVLHRNHRFSRSPAKPGSSVFTIPKSPGHRPRPKPHPKTPQRNPFLPPDTKPTNWNGLVDLSKSGTPGRTAKDKDKTPAAGVGTGMDSDDSFELPPGMSPPVTMDFARPVPRIGRTPKKDAASRIAKHLLGTLDTQKSVRTAGRGTGGIFVNSDISSSTAPTPPSLAKYRRGYRRYEPEHESSDASDIPKGISPPTTIQFTRTLRMSQLGHQNILLAQEGASPTRASASRASSTVPPAEPSLFRHDEPTLDIRKADGGPEGDTGHHLGSTTGNTTLEDMMRQVGLLAPGASFPQSAGPSPSQPRLNEDDDDFDEDDYEDGAEDQTVGRPRLGPGPDVDDVDGSMEDYHDSDSSSDSLERAGPSAAFLMAARRQGGDSDTSSDSFDNDDGEAGMEGDASVERAGAVHHSDGRIFDDDASFTREFDDVEQGGTTSSLFGPRGQAGAPLRMMGEELLEETIGIGAYMAATGRGEQSPTPHTHSD